MKWADRVGRSVPPTAPSADGSVTRLPDGPLRHTMLESLSGPMRALVSRLAVLAAGVLLGVAAYAAGVGGVAVVPVTVVGVLVVGEISLFVAGEDFSS